MFALQLSTEAIDNVMTGKRGWERYGLGRTGDSAHCRTGSPGAHE